MKRCVSTFFVVIMTTVMSVSGFPDTQRSVTDIFDNLAAVEESDFAEGTRAVTTENPKKPIIALAEGANITIADTVLQRKPDFLIETATVVPYNDTNSASALLAVYNAVSRVRALKGITYPSFRRQKDVPLFEAATRMESDKKNADVVNDPPPATLIPEAERVYLKLKDVNFGNCYYTAALEKPAGRESLVYTIRNNKTIDYGLIPVLKTDNFYCVFYFEHVTEGILIYSATGIIVSKFAASLTDVPSAMEKRINVFRRWIVAGLEK